MLPIFMRTLCIFDNFQNLSVPSEMNRLLHFELKCRKEFHRYLTAIHYYQALHALTPAKIRVLMKATELRHFQRKCRIKVSSHLFGVFDKSKRATKKVLATKNV